MTETSAFAPWPSLAAFGRELADGGGKEKLFYYDVPGAGSTAGSKRGTIILIHGLGDEADSWRRLIPLLSGEGLRILAPDLPGFGRSRIRGAARLRRHRDAVLNLAEHCAPSGGPVILAGNSMGALIAEAAAFARPRLPHLKALVLIDGCIPMEGRLPPALALQGIPLMGRRYYRSLRGKPEDAYRSLEPYYHKFGALPEEDRNFLRRRVTDRVESRAQEDAYFNSLRSLIWAYGTGASAYGKKLAAWPGRVLFIWGAEDRILPPAAADRARALRPDAGFSLIPGAGHLPHQEQPRAVAERLLEFTASV
jgi:pimeloyl-ACP methyl ester carboxylesterase